MIFQFPDLETFRLAVTSAQVPPEVSAAPAEVAFDASGRPSVRPSVDSAPRRMLNALTKLGVKQAKDHYAGQTLSIDCWPQVLPVIKSAAAPEITSTTPVLFEMPATEMPTLVKEMLRLGNDRQSYRTLAAAKGSGERVLLKVIGPPYYTLLRAIDKTMHNGSTITAYVETAPRVWIELGYQHPMAARLQPANGQALLLRPEREWTTIEDGPFHDVYEAIEFQLPAASIEWQASQFKSKLAVPLKLVPGNATDMVELWVLTDEAVDQVDALVRDAEERLLSRLLFAVATESGQTTIVLKTRPSKLPPPVLPLDRALGFKPYWKLPNLFLPAGKRLMPTLRREAVRNLLADDPAQVVWLMPRADGKFVPEMLPDDAFRPLADWVDYVIDHEHEKLSAWINATQFDFDSFICRDDQQDQPKPPTDKARKGQKRDRDDSLDKSDREIGPGKGATKKPTASDATELNIAPKIVPPSELKVRLREVEEQFKNVDGPLDDPQRTALWPQLARLNAGLNDKSEAAICWNNAFWEVPDLATDGTWNWLHSEDPEASQSPTATEWDAALGVKMPSPEAIRGLAARVIHACQLRPVPQSFVNRLPRVREYLERHENMLGVRAVWLVWWHLNGLGGPAQDVKAVAHVRDRLLQRLLTEGLNKERDLPVFLRMTGEENSERMRSVRDRAKHLYAVIEKWHSANNVEVNKPYVDLMFAFGFAKLGESTAARDLMNGAVNLLLNDWNRDPIMQRAHEVLAKGFVWRIENALAGKPHAGQLPVELQEQIKVIDRDRGQNGPTPKYIVDRMIEQSWILEPEEAIDPYGEFISSRGIQEKHQIESLTDPKVLRATIDRLFKSDHDSVTLLGLLNCAAGYVHRAGEEYAIKFVTAIPMRVFNHAVQSLPDNVVVNTRMNRASLLSRMLFIAAHYGRPELVDRNLELVFQVLNEKSGQDRYEILNSFAYQSIRQLRKLGMKDQIDRLLRQIRDIVIEGKTLSQLRSSSGSNWVQVLGSMLSLAGGWQFFGGYAEAKAYLDEARDTIANNPTARPGFKIGAKDLASLVRRYIVAVGLGPVDDALLRIEDLFANLERLPNTYSTGTHYSRLHLNIVEEVVRSLMTENMTLGDQARRWLDDDEYLVRRRIHGDMRKLLAAHGL
jgi:cellulose synthase operon protein C